MTHRILIVDDDEEILSLLAEFLLKNSYIPSLASSIFEARQIIKNSNIDLVILDLMMQGENGIDFLSSLDSNYPPIIVLTALADVDDRINALELGAEDYLAKPFEVKELLLRIQKLLNRISKKPQIVKFGNYEFDIDKSQLTIDGIRVNLTSTEMMLLKKLAQNFGQVVSREDIIKSIRFTSLRTVDAQISRLRSKILNGQNHLYAIRHKGYILQ